jgi:hypothetical protein
MSCGARIHRDQLFVAGQGPCNIEGWTFGIAPIAEFSPWEIVMGKGNSRRGNREAKKPKQEKPKAQATAGYTAGKPISLGEKKGK